MAAPQYRHLVETDDKGARHARLYDGTDAADAMAAWSKAVSDGAEYVTLESLVVPGPVRTERGAGGDEQEVAAVPEE